MTEVRSLPISEKVRFNKRRIRKMVENFGEQATQKLIGSAVEDITSSMAAIERAVACNDYPSALHPADRISDLGWQLGLPSLAGVARNLRDCILRENETAATAICCRLMRTGDLSLAAIRRYHESE